MAEFKTVTAADFAKKKRRATTAFRAESAAFDGRSGRLLVQLTNGVQAAFPISLIKVLENAAPQDLKKIEVQGRGFGLHMASIDADISVSRLFADLLGSPVMEKSERRMIASQGNGMKGGRPTTAARASA